MCATGHPRIEYTCRGCGRTLTTTQRKHSVRHDKKCKTYNYISVDGVRT